jgi:tetratricopeptide (TPR) repeat protein
LGLEQAVKLLPRSVAAHSLLATAYAANVRWDLYGTMMDSGERLTAVTPEDNLFKGYAESCVDPPGGLKTLDEAIRQWPNSPIARVLRTDARTKVAMDSGNVDLAQAAIDDAYVAKAMLPGNPQAIAFDLVAHLVAVEAFRDAGQKDQADASLRQAERDAQELEQFPALPIGYETRCMYLALTRQEQAAQELARKAYQEVDCAATRRMYVCALYERGEFEKALEVIDRAVGTTEVSSRDAKLGSGVYFLRPIILAEMPDGPSRALQACRENCGLHILGVSPIWSQAMLLLLGERGEAIAAGRELRNPPKGGTGLGPHYGGIVDCWAGTASVEDLHRAEAGSRWSQCETHFYVALDRLSQGDRPGAREHFQKAVATRVFFFGEYIWSHLFLERMDEDPNWPPWIPLQEPTSQATSNHDNSER